MHEPRPHKIELGSHILAGVLKFLLVEEGCCQSYLIRIVRAASFKCLGARLQRAEVRAVRREVPTPRHKGPVRTYRTLRWLRFLVRLVDELTECMAILIGADNLFGANRHVRLRNDLVLFGRVRPAPLPGRGRGGRHLCVLLDTESISSSVGTPCREVFVVVLLWLGFWRYIALGVCFFPPKLSVHSYYTVGAQLEI